MEFSRVRVICNPASKGGDYDPESLEPLLGELSPEWIVTEGAGDATGAAREWDEGLLVVAGGDGTVNEVVNGLGEAGFPAGVTLAIIPAGTGNDLAETLAIPNDSAQAADLVKSGEVRTLDAARIRSRGDEEQFFANVATGGMGANISKLADDELKSQWGRLAYLRASMEIAQEFEPREMHLVLDDGEHELRAVNIAVGNCRYAGGGWPATPRANPEDGLLDLVVVQDIGMRELMKLGPRALTRTDYLDAEGVFFTRSECIRIETTPLELQFTADGEVMGQDPAEFIVLPRSLNVIVGPQYTAEVGK